MNKTQLDRRAIIKAMLLGSAAPWVLNSKAFAASSCDDHVVRVGTIVAPDSMNPFATWSSYYPTVYT
ncbi:ABC transporter, partial [Mesorhizobium sp. M0730]